jgi:hypothetical protein
VLGDAPVFGQVQVLNIHHQNYFIGTFETAYKENSAKRT